MELLPLAVVDTPIACRLGAGEMAERVRAWVEVNRRALLGSDAGAGTAVLRYRQEPGIAEELRRLVGLEEDCCAFLTFDLATTETALILTVSGPEAAGPIMEAFIGTQAEALT